MIRFIKPMVLFAIAALSLAACNQGQKIPDWVKTGKADDSYKAIEYMIGVGQGPSVEAAKDNARAEIAKQFSVKIESHMEVLQKDGVISESGQESWLTQTNIQDLTRTYTEETIQGIQIAEVWQNSETGEAWAMAVLRRSPALMRLQVQVTDLDEKIQNLYGNSQKAEDVLLKVRPLVRALELVKEREIKNQQLMVVNYAGAGIEADVSPAMLNAALTETLSSLKIAVVIAGDDADGRIRKAIVTSLTNGRIMVQDDAESAQIVIKGTVTVKETNKGNQTPYTFAKISAYLTMVNNADGRTFGQVEHSMRDGANSWDDAVEKTMLKLTRQIVLDFNAKLYEYLSL